MIQIHNDPIYPTMAAILAVAGHVWPTGPTLCPRLKQLPWFNTVNCIRENE